MEVFPAPAGPSTAIVRGEIRGTGVSLRWLASAQFYPEQGRTRYDSASCVNLSCRLGFRHRKAYLEGKRIGRRAVIAQVIEPLLDMLRHRKRPRRDPPQRHVRHIKTLEPV